MPDHSGNIARHVPADTGPAFFGPGDRYTFLVTGAQSDGAYFIVEAIVPPEGGPPLHIHHREQESFYVLEGTLDITLGDKVVKASTGDFVHVPRGIIHAFRNVGSGMARTLLINSPAGFEKFFEETLDPVKDRSARPPAVSEALLARYAAAAPKHGLELL